MPKEILKTFKSKKSLLQEVAIKQSAKDEAIAHLKKIKIKDRQVRGELGSAGTGPSSPGAINFYFPSANPPSRNRTNAAARLCQKPGDSIRASSFDPSTDPAANFTVSPIVTHKCFGQFAIDLALAIQDKPAGSVQVDENAPLYENIEKIADACGIVMVINDMRAKVGRGMTMRQVNQVIFSAVEGGLTGGSLYVNKDDIYGALSCAQTALDYGVLSLNYKNSSFYLNLTNVKKIESK